MAFSMSRSLLTLGVAAVGVSIAVTGCSMAQKPAATTASATTAPAKPQGYVDRIGAAQLWQQTCSHCHNLRDPGTYSDAQWDVAMMDMRFRAQLTTEEQQKILLFLKSANK